jgi:UDP:flavonoid glycosyltransferase YjiC (YdhE family)
MVGTLPALEYPREWPAHVHVVGPLLWEPPYEVEHEPPAGDAPLIVVAPSTSQDQEHRLLRAAVEGLAHADVRVLATWNRKPLTSPPDVGANTRLVEWLAYSRAMREADVVVCHGGHGTVVRALASGCAVVACPVAGDMYENAARIDWARVGVRVPHRLLGPRSLRLAVGRALASPEIRMRARDAGAWLDAHDPAAIAAGLVERLAQQSAGADRASAPASLS